MPIIPFPDVPDVAGVPALPRALGVPISATVSLGAVQELLSQAQSSATSWGIFDSDGNQLGVTAGSNGLFSSILQTAESITGLAPVLSTNAFEFVKETNISDFPVEQGGFATYNKVVLPATPTVTLALAGSVSDRTHFMNQIDDAVQSTDLYSIVTPELVYYNYSLMSYRMIRRQDRGATLIMLEIPLKEIRNVSAAFSMTVTPIVAPQNPAATPPSNTGQVQAVPSSTLYKILGSR